MHHYLFLRPLTIVLLAAALSLPAFSQQPLSPQKAADLRAQICANFFMPDPLPALDAHVHRTFSPAPGVRAEAVTYASQLGMRVTAILYLPDPLPVAQTAKSADATQSRPIQNPESKIQNPKLPAFLVINGHSGDKYTWYAYYTGITFARAGAAVLTFDPYGEGERSRNRSGKGEHDYVRGSPTMPDDIAARHLFGAFLTDVRQAVSYLCSRPEVDPTRIAAGGYSLGSLIMAVAGAIEPRLRACIMTGGGNLDGEGGYWEGISNKPMCSGYPYRALRFLGDRPAIIYALHATHAASLVWNGREDICNIKRTQEPFFDDLRARVAKLTAPENQKNILTYGFTPAPARHRPYLLTKPVVLWLNQQIHFPNWTEEQIKAMPETHISEWAAQVRYPLSPMYATEIREGGTLAVGAGVPGIDREQLSVFTPAEWNPIQDQYTLDAWLKKVGATTNKDRPKEPKPRKN